MKISGLTKILLAGVVVASSMFSNKLDGQIHESNYNPFKTPNITNTERGAYGSGDVDQDGDIDWDDYNAMSSMQNDWSDVDGNGIPSTPKDKQELSEYLNGTRPYLRGHWNRLQTREERRAWADSLLANDGISIDEIPANPPCWMSAHYGNATQVKHFGWEKASPENNDLPPIYSSEENGRFNIPIFRASYEYPGFGHGFNAILIGDNPLNFGDWQFIEPQGNKVNDLYDMGTWQPKNESIFKIGNSIEFLNPIQIDCGLLYGSNIENIVEFKINDQGQPEVTYQNPNLVLSRPAVGIEDNENTNISDKYLLKQNYPNPFNSSTTIQYDLNESAQVKFNIYDISGHLIENINIGSMSVGNHDIHYNSEDLSSGIYFYQLSVDGILSKPMKMTILK